MSRFPRGVVVPALVLAVAFSLMSGVPAANASRVLPPSDRSMPRFTHAHARAVLRKAKSQLRRDTARLRAHRPVGSSPSTDITMTLRDLFLARPSLTGQERQQADAILARPTDPGGDDVDSGPAITYGSNPTAHYCGPMACIHWTTGGPERLNASELSTDANHNGVPDYVDTVYATVAHVLAYEHGVMGYRLPLADGGSGGADANPDGTIDIYLANLQPRGLYGYCAPDDAFNGRRVPGYCVLDKAFVGYGTAPAKALDVTAAHELFHASQFAYDDAEDSWFMEGTATWMEDEVYDSINDNLQFLAYSPIRYPTAPVDLTTDFHRYGSWIFFKYASERLGRDIVRQMWQRADASTGLYSLLAIKAAVTARTSWAPFMATFAAWNLKQPHGYSEASHYPAPDVGGHPRARQEAQVDRVADHRPPAPVLGAAARDPGLDPQAGQAPDRLGQPAAHRARLGDARAAPLQERHRRRLDAAPGLEGRRPHEDRLQPKVPRLRRADPGEHQHLDGLLRLRQRVRRWSGVLLRGTRHLRLRPALRGPGEGELSRRNKRGGPSL